MTVYTKIGALDESKDVKNVAKKSPLIKPKVIDAGYRPNNFFYCNHYHELTRKKVATSIIFIILAFWLFLAILISSIFLLQRLNRQSIYIGHFSAEFFDKNAPKFDNLKNQLEERVEIDITKAFEDIHVPRFGRFRSSRVLHDFAKNVTAIIDAALGQCFVRALDAIRAVPPGEMIRTVGRYERDLKPKIHRERFKVRRPHLSIFQVRKSFGSPLISTECSTYKTYKLEIVPRTDPSIFFSKRRRSMRSIENKPEMLEYAFYNGNGIVVEEIIEF